MKSIRIRRGLYVVRLIYRGHLVVRMIKAANAIDAENILLDELGANACAN
jgi:hypothetical protein